MVVNSVFTHLQLQNSIPFTGYWATRRNKGFNKIRLHSDSLEAMNKIINQTLWFRSSLLGTDNQNQAYTDGKS